MALQRSGWQTLKRLFAYTRPQRRQVILALLMLLLATALDLAGPWLIKQFVDHHLVPGQYALAPLALLLGAYLSSQLSAAWLSYRQSVTLSSIALGVVQRVREQLFHHVLHLPMAAFDYTPTGALVGRITNDTEAVRELFVQVLGTFVQSAVRVVGVLLAMWLLSPSLALICLGFLPAAVLVMVLYRRWATPVLQRTRHLLAQINARLSEQLAGMALIHLFNRQALESKRFADLGDDYVQARGRSVRLDALLLRPMVDLLQWLTLAALFYRFGSDVLQGTLEIGLLYAFVTYLGRFIEPVIELTQRLSALQQSLVAGERVFEWLDQQEERDGDQQPARGAGALQLQGVDFRYRDGLPLALEGITLNITPGHFIGIVGHTGSGKSTLAALLLRFYRPSAGQIRLDGVDINALPARTFRQRLAMVQQDSFLFAGSLRDNLDIGRGLSDQRLHQALEDVGLRDWLARQPDDLALPIREGGSNLSSGQRQLLCLARALAGDPEVLLLDEATAQVDSQVEQQVQRAVARLHGRVTVIAIAHRLATVMAADEILVLHRGHIQQRGSHAALLAEEGLYRHLFELQSWEAKGHGPSV